MILLASVGCLACALVLAILSLRDPARAARLERWSGLCFLLGLVLLGVGLQVLR